MNWTQVVDPLHNPALSTIIAALPIALIFWALIIKKMKGYKAALFTLFSSLVIAIAIYGMPAQLAVLSALHGVFYALFPICWIIFSALFLFNLTVQSGKFEIIKNYLASITSDRRLQILLIAFSFGSFLEGTAGFATPVVITSALLYSLGFQPLYAAGICLIANTAPVAFGSAGIPVVVASNVSGISEMAISQMVGRTLPFISLLLPFYMVAITAGFKKAMEIWPACFISGFSFAFFQWFSSTYLGPALPDIIAGIASIISLLVLLKYWKPKQNWSFAHETEDIKTASLDYSNKQILNSLAPFIILTIIIICWSSKALKSTLDNISYLDFKIPLLHDAIISSTTHTPISQIFKLNYLSASGTAIFLSAIISVPIVGLTYKQAFKTLLATLKQLKYPVITVTSIMAFAYVSNNSGMSNTLARALTSTGYLFPFFAPILGWLGVFITGSDTSSNALFGRLQKETAIAVGIDPVIAVAANCSGGVVGKMISPQSIAVAAAAGGLTGQESKLFRFTVKHSFIILFVICLIVLLQAYL